MDKFFIFFQTECSGIEVQQRQQKNLPISLYKLDMDLLWCSSHRDTISPYVQLYAEAVCLSSRSPENNAVRCEAD